MFPPCHHDAHQSSVSPAFVVRGTSVRLSHNIYSSTTELEPNIAHQRNFCRQFADALTYVIIIWSSSDGVRCVAVAGSGFVVSHLTYNFMDTGTQLNKLASDTHVGDYSTGPRRLSLRLPSRSVDGVGAASSSQRCLSNYFESQPLSGGLSKNTVKSPLETYSILYLDLWAPACGRRDFGF